MTVAPFIKKPWPVQLRISMGYIGTAIGLLLPIFVYKFEKHFRFLRQILFTILSFSFAIGFRMLDNHIDFLPMGSHWLWHSFGAISLFFLIYLPRSKTHRKSVDLIFLQKFSACI